MNKERIDHALSVITKMKVNTSNFYEIRISCATKLNNSLDSLRDEICRAICFNLYQAAISLTNQLTETFLRLNVVINDSGATDYDDEALEKIDAGFAARKKQALYVLVNEALKSGIIDQDQADKINEFRTKYRNPYSHGSPHQLLEMAGDMQMFTASFTDPTPLGSDNIKKVSIQSQFHLHGFFQRAYASRDSIPYFKYIDSLIMDFYKNK